MSDMQLVLFPTPAMEKGHAAVFQCSWCGTLVAVPSDGRRDLGPCPSCRRDVRWWRQRVPVEGHVAGPFHVRQRR